MKKHLSQLVEWWKVNGDLVFAAAFFGLAITVWNPLSVFFICFGLHGVQVYGLQKHIRFLQAANEMLDKMVNERTECITVLINRLAPYIGEEEVLKILAAHNVEIEKIIKDFTDKWGKGGPKKPRKEKEKQPQKLVIPSLVDAPAFLTS